MKKRTSSIWVTPKNKLEKIVQSSETLAEVLKKINIIIQSTRNIIKNVVIMILSFN